MTALPLLPLFPLPNIVLFPGVPLPLHIFEPRYRAMIADALEGDRRIGMVLLQPGFEADYDGRPPIYPIGCSGVIVHAAQLEDGRYNILLHGLERVRVVNEDHEQPYRRATVEAWPDPPLDVADREAMGDLRGRLEALIGPSVTQEQGATESPTAALASMPDAEFVHAVAHAMDLEPLEKQALLERENLRLRAQSLLELVEMRRLMNTLPPAPQRPH